MPEDNPSFRPSRVPKGKEAERVVRSLLANGDELFQFTQLKASLRLLRDDETIDKDLLNYCDAAVSIRFNSLLKEAVPRTERADRSVGEILSVTDDKLLLMLKSGKYFVRSSGATRVPFEDLHYWAADGGYSLSVTENRDSTIVSKEEGGRYLVKCPKCDDQHARLVKEGKTVVAIACARCKTRVVVKRSGKTKGQKMVAEPEALTSVSE